MKTLDSILRAKKTFEPSSGVKKLILKSIKKPLGFNLGAQDVEIPGFISYDTDKYRHYTMMVFLLYTLEFFAAISIIVTTTQAFYIVIKLFLVVALILLDIIVAKHNRSKDDELNSNLFRSKYFTLLRDFYEKRLSDSQLTQIRNGISECDNKVKDVKSFMGKMLILLFVLALVKVLVFFLDYIIEGFDWDFILSKDAGFLSFFFGAPIAYLSIPLIAWFYYGKWIWTGMASKNLEKELETFKMELNQANIDRVGEINNCIVTSEDRPITLETLVDDFSRVVEISGENDGTNKIVSTPNKIPIREGMGSSWRIKSKNEKYVIDYFGLLTDNELLQIVSLQDDNQARRLLLLICMTNQIIQSHRSSRDSIQFQSDFQNILKSVKDLP